MLNDYKKLCANVADATLPNWRELSKNDLLNGYLKCKNTCLVPHNQPESLLNGYIAALLFKYWNKIQKSYESSKSAATKEDCFSWVSRAIMYALTIDKPEEIQHRTPVWTQQYITRVDKTTGESKVIKNPLYEDPAGPDRTVTKCIQGERMIFYQSSNYPMRKSNVGNLSIQGLYETKQDYILPKSTENLDSFTAAWIHSLVSNYFNKKDYIKGLIIDCIVNGEVFCKSDKSFKLSRVKKHILNFISNDDFDYIDIFLNEYKMSRDILKDIRNSKEFTKDGKIRVNLLNKLIDTKFESLREELADSMYA